MDLGTGRLERGRWVSALNKLTLTTYLIYINRNTRLSSLELAKIARIELVISGDGLG